MKEYSKKEKFSNASLLPPSLFTYINLGHIAIDELHLMMRIVDVLIRNIKENSLNLDQR